MAFLQTDTHLRGIIYPAAGDALPLSGSLTGTSVGFSAGQLQGTLFSATGTLDAETNAMTGTWTKFVNLDLAGQGNWHASLITQLISAP